MTPSEPPTPKDPTNEDRAARIDLVVRAYEAARVDVMDEPFETMTDLLADLRHWAAREKMDFESALRISAGHFDSETACPKCGGSGFNGNGTGYSDVCDECGGTRRRGP